MHRGTVTEGTFRKNGLVWGRWRQTQTRSPETPGPVVCHLHGVVGSREHPFLCRSLFSHALHEEGRPHHRCSTRGHFAPARGDSSVSMDIFGASSLVVSRLGLGACTTIAQVQSLVWELIDIPHYIASKKKRRKKKKA